jgi:hypothetical protein
MVTWFATANCKPRRGAEVGEVKRPASAQWRTSWRPKVLTEAQVIALEKAKTEKEAYGDRERVSGLLRRPEYVLCR